MMDLAIAVGALAALVLLTNFVVDFIRRPEATPQPAALLARVAAARDSVALCVDRAGCWRRYGSGPRSDPDHEPGAVHHTHAAVDFG